MLKEYIRYLIYILEIYILYAIEEVPQLNICEVSIFWVIIGFVCISLFEKEFVSMAFGIFSGMLIDLSFRNFLGLNALILGVLGYILGVIFSYYIRNNFLSAMFIVGIISSLVLIINTAISASIKNFDFQKFYFSYAPAIVLTVLMALPIYFLNRTISYAMREKKK